MLNPNELWYWRGLLPSGEFTPVFRAATRDDAAAYCEHVGWGSLDLEGHSPELWAIELACTTEVTDG